LLSTPISASPQRPPNPLPYSTRFQSTDSPAVMLNALDSGQIDVLITWQPAIGAFLSRHPDLEVVAVPNARTRGAPEQYAFPMSIDRKCTRLNSSHLIISYVFFFFNTR